MIHYLQNFYKKTLDSFIAPPFCASCKKYLSVREVFCAACDAKIKPITSYQLPISTHYTMNVFAVSEYQEPLRSLIIAKSWGDIIASNQLAQVIWQKTLFKDMQCDYLVPVPLHWMRYAKRGYNQAEEIARELSTFKRVPLASILTRSRWTPFQSAVAVEQRKANVKGNFIVSCKNITQYENKHLIIIDDLMTSGATLREVGRTLVPLKPASINCIVACRVIHT